MQHIDGQVRLFGPGEGGAGRPFVTPRPRRVLPVRLPAGQSGYHRDRPSRPGPGRGAGISPSTSTRLRVPVRTRAARNAGPAGDNRDRWWGARNGGGGFN